MEEIALILNFAVVLLSGLELIAKLRTHVSHLAKMGEFVIISRTFAIAAAQTSMDQFARFPFVAT